MVQPIGEMRATVADGFVLGTGQVKDVAEVDGNSGEPLLEHGVRGRGQTLGIWKVHGDDARARFGNEKAGAFKQFHQGAGARETAFRKEDEAAPLLQKFGHPLHRISGESISTMKVRRFLVILRWSQLASPPALETTNFQSHPARRQ